MKKSKQSSYPLNLFLTVLFYTSTVFYNGALCCAFAAELQRNFVYPLVGTRISSAFGQRNHPVLRRQKHHKGIDLAAPEDASIRAIQSGIVVYADPHGGYGNLVVIAHGDSMTSHYGHCNKLLVKIGSKVQAGQVIATVGSTGMVTGPHLHFEVRKGGQPLDPEKLFPFIAKNGVG